MLNFWNKRGLLNCTKKYFAIRQELIIKELINDPPNLGTGDQEMGREPGC